MTTKTIPVGDQFATVDEEDFPVLSRHTWHASKQGSTTYAHRNVSKSIRYTESMHRLVMGAPKNRWFVVDHIDGNGLNNTKANLRFVSVSGNLLNRVRTRAGLTGVREVRPGRWTARIVIEKKYRHLGTFDTRAEAVAAQQAAITNYFNQEGKP
jgi:hypothetical protein